MYTQLPQLVDPFIFMIGDFAVRWYGVMWAVAFVIVCGIVAYWVHHGDVWSRKLPGITGEFVWDFGLYAFLGAVIGGRLGYVLFYDFAYFMEYPLQIIWPFVDGDFVGLSGMSFHGGVVGVGVVLWWIAHRRGWHLLDFADLIVPAIPIGYFFGRIGNFLNGELWGRITTFPSGMYFPTAPDGGTELRHPSQLYEAFFEGIVLFVILMLLRSRTTLRGVLTGVFLCGYAVARFGVEFVRAPDAHLGIVLFGLTMGQVLSGVMMVVGMLLLIRAYWYK